MVSVYSNGYSCLCITFFIYLRAYVFDIRYDNVLVCANTKKNNMYFYNNNHGFYEFTKISAMETENADTECCEGEGKIG